jgi:hypothetical protein
MSSIVKRKLIVIISLAIPKLGPAISRQIYPLAEANW